MSDTLSMTQGIRRLWPLLGLARFDASFRVRPTVKPRTDAYRPGAAFYPTSTAARTTFAKSP